MTNFGMSESQEVGNMSMQVHVRAQLTANYRLLLERLRDHPRLESASYKLFAPRTGRSYDRELMLVGRSLYGWGTASLKKELLMHHPKIVEASSVLLLSEADFQEVGARKLTSRRYWYERLRFSSRR